jgi:hypothetical protein
MAAFHNVIEQSQTRNQSYNNGKSTASRTFVIWHDTPATLSTPFDVREFFGIVDGSGNALPMIGDLMEGERDLFAISFDIERIENSQYVWQVKYQYGTGGGSRTQPEDEGYVQMTLDFQSSFKSNFRRGALIPTNGNPTNEFTDIGGTSIDVAGNPMSAPYYQTVVSISETRHGSISMVSNQNTKIRSQRATRNSALFYGSPVGSLLFQGARVSRIGVDTWTFNYEFTEAADFHLIQVPKINLLGNVATTLVSGVERATSVFWHQPFPTFSDHNLLSTNF